MSVPHRRFVRASYTLVLAMLLTFVAACTPATPDTSTLRGAAAAHGKLVGAAVATEPFRANDQVYMDTLKTQYNLVVAENFTKWDYINPQPGIYQWDLADKLVGFAQSSGMQVKATPLVWYSQLPLWVKQISDKAQARQTLETYIKTVVGHYKGKIYAWDVVNEAVADNGGPREETYWRVMLGPEYVALAFRWAHEADPAAKLYYNDYGAEGAGAKADGVYRLLAGLKQQGVPINGVGWQMHVTADWRMDETYRRNADRLGALGLELSITELDALIEQPASAQRLAAQARAYHDAADFCLTQPNCVALITWGFSDRYSWIPAFYPKRGSALPFDADYKPKPAFTALHDRLAEPLLAPTPPNLLRAIPTNGAVTLIWSGGGEALGFRISVVPQAGGAARLIDVSSTLSTTVDGLRNGSAYRFSVVATNGQNASASSNQLTATPTSAPPNAPTLQPLESNIGTLTARWARQPDALGYRFAYTVAGEHTTLDLGDTTGFTLTGLVNGTPYTITVSAYNANGEAPSAEARGTPGPPPPAQISVTRASGPISIDGNLDESVWPLAIPVAKTRVGSVNNTTHAGVLWDETYLYIGVQVLDGQLYKTSNVAWQNDSVEVYLDSTNDRLTADNRNSDRRFTIGWNDDTLHEQNDRTHGVLHAWHAIPGGYTVALVVPWANLGVTPHMGTQFGIDIANNDDDHGTGREGQSVAFATVENWRNLANLAQLTLADTTP